MKVYFSHGKDSGPRGTKIQSLAAIARQYDFDVDSLDYTSIDSPEKRVEKLLTRLARENDEYILMGTSLGGYVALVASENVNASGLFLIAPALYMSGCSHQTYSSTCKQIEIIHGWSDEIIPPEHSIRFARQADCTLHLISGDHRLIDSLPTIEVLFEHFLKKYL